MALQDSEPWVSMLADLLSSFPSSGQLNHEARGEGRKIYTDLMTDLKKTLKKHGDQSDLVLPLECHFLNKNAFISVVGHQPQPTKHFSLKRKPKAAALKADLIQRSQEAANKAKSQLNSFPSRQRTMPKKMSDTGPLRGLPSRPLANAGFRNPRVSMPNRQLGKKEGGVKMLEITEQPIGYAAAKKRKRQQEMEEAKRVAEEAAVTNANAKTEASAANTVPSTPDYAANLSSNIGAGGVPPPAYAPPTPAAPAPAPAYAPAPAVTVPLATPQASLPGTTVTVPALPTQPLPQTAAVTRLVQLPTQPLPASQLSHSPMVTPSAGGQAGVTRQVTVGGQQQQQPQAAALQPQQLVQLQQQAVVQQRQQPPAPGQPQQFQQPQILRQVKIIVCQSKASASQWTSISAFCANHPDACAAAEKEPVPDQGADAGGPGDVQDRQQGHQAREGAHSRLHGRVKVSPG